MESEKTNITTDVNLTMISNLITSFPMGCACYEAIFDKKGIIYDYVVVGLNAIFESIHDVKKEKIIGKSLIGVFTSLSVLFLNYLLQLGNETYKKEEKVGVTQINICNHVYKLTFFFITDKLLFVIYEDIQPQYLRMCCHSAIPRDMIIQSIAEKESETRDNIINQTPIVKTNIPYINETMQIIPEILNIKERYDSVFRDSLTGLYNRFFAMEILRMYIDQNIQPISVALGDINGLGAINETTSYDGGDKILVKVGKTIKSFCSADDIVARWSDDTFIILLPNTSRDDTQMLIKQIQKSLNNLNESAYTIVTFGYSTNDRQSKTAEELIREAEKWMYRKKLLVDQSHRSSTIRLLLSVLDEKSMETHEHSERMAEHSRQIAYKLDLSEDLTNDLLLLSILHDIGKIGIPDEILNKPGSLTFEERSVIERHPEIGYRITRSIPELLQVSSYILAHHERWDGKGYPNGLEGDEIPIASRIIAAVDAYDVMISGRVYRPARSQEEAIMELRRCSGTQFDPNIVDVYINLLRENDRKK